MTPGTHNRFSDAALLTVAAVGLLLAASAVLGSGVDTLVFGIRIASRTLLRPLTIATAAALLWLYGSDARQQRAAAAWAWICRHGTLMAFVPAAVTLAIALRISAIEAYGSDSYGYVSQAHLWEQGDVVQHEPLALRAPWPYPEWTLSPLGYRPGPAPGTIVPIYAPGLPIVMAGLLKLFGSFGPFLAVPLFGGISVYGTFLLGRRLAGGACGLIAATLLMTSPIFLFQLKEPMSDVPVTAWWILAFVSISRPARSSLLAGGLFTTAAILTRPNLAPLAGLVALVILVDSAPQWREGVVNAVFFSLMVLPGCVAIGILHNRLYGSPLSSGYGQMSELFGLEYFWTNLGRYSAWLLQSETAFVLLAAAGVFLLHRDATGRAAPAPLPPAALSRWLVAFVAALYACYALYLPFDTWLFLRFLLPGVAVLLILCAAALVRGALKLPTRFAAFTLGGALILFFAWRATRPELAGLQPIRGYGRRFAVVAEYVRDELPPNAIVFSSIHSGSVRYYAHRPTVRWDWMAPEWLDRSVDFLVANGYHPFLLLDDWERPVFTERFRAHSRSAMLESGLIAAYRGNVRAELFDLLSGASTSTTRWIGEGRFPKPVLEHPDSSR